MKKLIFLVAFLVTGIFAFNQSTLLLRGDTIRSYKQADTAVHKVDSILVVTMQTVIGKNYNPLFPSVSLMLSDSTRAIRINRMFTRNNIVTPQNGMMIYEDSTNKFLRREASTWVDFGSGGGGDSTTLFPLLKWDRILANETFTGFYFPKIYKDLDIDMMTNKFFIDNATDFGVNLNTNEFAISGNNGSPDNITIIASDVDHTLRILNAISSLKKTEIKTVPDSLMIFPDQGRINIDSLRTGTSADEIMTWRSGMVGKITKDTLASTIISNIDTGAITDIKIMESHDKRRGNALGSLYDQTTFANVDTFVTSGVTATISGSKILLGDGSTSASTVTLKRYTMLNRWTIKAGFKVGEKSSDSYAFQIGIQSENDSYVQNIAGSFYHRSTPSNFSGFLELFDGASINHSLGVSATAVSFSQGDSIEVTLNRNLNVFTFTARNVTTGGAEDTVSYTYNDLTTAVNTGRPYMSAVGSDSVYNFSFYSDETVGADLINIGDSKDLWYGANINQSISSSLYASYGNVINHSGSGDKTREVVLTLDELIALNGRQWNVNIGSNDIRNSISSGTWQANYDTIYNRGTRAGVEVYFSLSYETDADQSPLIAYLMANYPTRYIAETYEATRNCGSCLQADNIHLTAYGNKKVVEAITQSGMIDFMNPFREMKFIAGDASYIAIGDSLMTNRYFRSTNKLNVFRDGELQWKLEEGEPANGYRIRGDTLVFVPPLDTLERIDIQSYSHVNWVTMTPDVPVVIVSPDFVVFNTSGDLTESPTGTWSSSAGTGKGYSTTTLAAGDDGYFMVKNTDGGNTDQNPIILDDDGNNTENYDQCEFGIYREVISGNTYKVIDNGVVSTAGVGSAANDWIRLRKQGTTVYAEKSTNSGVTWTLVYTYSGNAGHTLYAKTHLVVAGKKIIDASVLNFH